MLILEKTIYDLLLSCPILGVPLWLSLVFSIIGFILTYLEKGFEEKRGRKQCLKKLHARELGVLLYIFSLILTIFHQYSGKLNEQVAEYARLSAWGQNTSVSERELAYRNGTELWRSINSVHSTEKRGENYAEISVSLTSQKYYIDCASVSKLVLAYPLFPTVRAYEDECAKKPEGKKVSLKLHKLIVEVADHDSSWDQFPPWTKFL